jgi:hypothetical protein
MIEITPLAVGYNAFYMFHTSIWFDDVCYLADLFVNETCTGSASWTSAAPMG